MSREVAIGRRMPPPKDVPLLISRTCGYAALQGKGELKLLIK